MLAAYSQHIRRTIRIKLHALKLHVSLLHGHVHIAEFYAIEQTIEVESQ